MKIGEKLFVAEIGYIGVRLDPALTQYAIYGELALPEVVLLLKMDAVKGMTLSF